ncbi:UBP-type zinc finger domain-containing protein [Leifsonia sp. fls2-241-R2A-40a]|uniref:UBP-type zinc finger domain-containing protein n=1 Tax=Leifsonia sp. fls2-241-R2A-40a TaxID=3040290 RepID=UPI00254E6926|nr:UBP-type zinc finger domain-containing protein [Leifsonia sp. fls2-241-R2A-40a]
MSDAEQNLGIDTSVPPSGTGCVECGETGSWWVHLRRCTECGHVGCCDDSLNTHATKHAASTGHPIIQSFEPDEDWFWDYRTQTFLEGPRLAPPESHPTEQTVPGPAERVPGDWRQQLAARR